MRLLWIAHAKQHVFFHPNQLVKKKNTWSLLDLWRFDCTRLRKNTEEEENRQNCFLIYSCLLFGNITKVVRNLNQKQVCKKKKGDFVNYFIKEPHV